MKILYNTDGSIKTTELDTYINQHSNNANYIDFAIKDLGNDTCTTDCVFVIPNGEEITLQPITKEVEINGTTYLGFRIYLTESTTAYSGTLRFVVRAYQNDNIVMYATPIKLTINATTRTTSEPNISEEEYNSMVAKFTNYIAKYDPKIVYKYDTLSLAENDTSLNENSRVLIGVSDYKIYKKTNGDFVEVKDANLSDYYDKTAVESIFADYYTTSEIDTKINDLSTLISENNLIEPNPNGTATIDLQTIKIGDTIYDLPTFLPYITLSSKNGTLTTSQLFVLQANESSYILYNGIKYYLSEKNSLTLTYSNVNDNVLSQFVITIGSKAYSYSEIGIETKTLFGKYSIYAPSSTTNENYDLFRYTLTLTNETETYVFNYISSVDMDVDSLTDLKTLLYVDTESKYIVGVKISDNSCACLCVASGSFKIGTEDISSYTITCEKETI